MSIRAPAGETVLLDQFDGVIPVTWETQGLRPAGLGTDRTPAVAAMVVAPDDWPVEAVVNELVGGHLSSGVMTLILGERYTITYRERGEERTALVHYRGFGTADTIARGDPTTSPSDEAGELHWFQIDGVPGYLTISEEDLLGYEVAEGYGG